MKAVAINDITTREIVPGFTGKYYHADNLSIGWLNAKAGHNRTATLSCTRAGKLCGGRENAFYN